MKRRASKLVLFLLLGAIMNVAVAWLAAAFVHERGEAVVVAEVDPKPGERWFIEREDHCAGTWVGSYQSQIDASNSLSPTLTQGIPRWAHFEMANNSGGQRFQAFGWPARSLYCEWLWSARDQQYFTNSQHGGLMLSTVALPNGDWATGRALPLRPVGFGFAMDTLIDAALLWLLTSAFVGICRLKSTRRDKSRKCRCGAWILKRRIFKLGLFLLLGAIINVAVAWGFALELFDKLRHSSQAFEFPTPGFYERSERSALSPRTFIHNDTGRITLWQDGPGFNADYFFAPKYLDEEEYRALVPAWSGLARGEPTVDRRQNGLMNYSETGSGWPSISLWCASEAFEYPVGKFSSRLICGIELPDSMRAHGLEGTLPCRPLWPGFAINTIFYTAIVWLLFAAPFAIRRRRRIKRGLCERCAYPVSASGGAVCSECGAVVHGAAAPCNPCSPN